MAPSPAGSIILRAVQPASPTAVPPMLTRPPKTLGRPRHNMNYLIDLQLSGRRDSNPRPPEPRQRATSRLKPIESHFQRLTPLESDSIPREIGRIAGELAP